jgi:hypothetical protein
MRRCGLALQETVIGGQPQPSDPGRCRAAAADPTVGPTVGRDPAREAPRPGWPLLDRALPISPGSTAARGSAGFLRWARDCDRERESDGEEMVGQVRTYGAGGRMWREKETLQVHGVSLDVGLKIHYRLI